MVGWLRRGERMAVVQRSGNRVRCRFGSGKFGWASVAVERTNTPLLRIREDAGTEGASLAVLGQRSQNTLTLERAPVIRRVALSPYQPHPSPSVESESTVDGVLSVVKVATRPSSRKVPVRLPVTPDRPLLFGCRMAEAGNLSVVKEVVAQLGKDAVENTAKDGSRSLLHCAARGGQLEIVQYLLTVGALPDAADINGNTPLMDAACCPGPLAHLCAATLLAAGANHEQLDARQHSATHHASLHGNSGVLRILLGAKAFVGGRCVPLGRTPLHLAAENNHPVCVQLLIDASADINARTVDGMTPLHCAAWCGALGPMHLLLRCGADASVRTQEGHTALDLATGFDRSRCAQLLQYHSVMGISENTSVAPDDCDLEMFSTPQQLLEQGLVVPLSDRVVAGLEAVAVCLGVCEAPESLSMDMKEECASVVQNSGRLRPLSAKSKAVAALLTLDEYEHSKQQKQSLLASGDSVTSDEENQNPADSFSITSTTTNNIDCGSLSKASRPRACDTHDDIRAIVRRQRSAPAIRSTSRSRSRTTSRPQTAGAAVHKPIPTLTRLVTSDQKPTSAGSGRAAVAMPHDGTGPVVLSVQGTVRSATLGWGVHEWEQANCTFKLAPMPGVWGAEPSTDLKASNKEESRRGASCASKAGLSDREQQGKRVRPKSAVGLASSVSMVDCRDRPGSAIPTTAEFQPPGVEEAAAHYLTAAQKLKRQEERLKLKMDHSTSVGSSRSVSVGLDLSLYRAETREERAEREAAEMQAAVSIQAFARGHFIRRRPQLR